MTTTTNNRTDLARRAGSDTVIAVYHGDREIGAYVVSGDDARFVPAVDVTGMVLTALGAATAMTIAVALAAGLRRDPEIGKVTMGPGGWISLKRINVGPRRSGARRPWWAHLLRAHRLVVER